MKFVKVFVTLIFVLLSTGVFADVYDPAYYNSQEYFFKDEIIENNFFPVMRLSDFLEGYEQNMSWSSEDLKYINVHITDDDWENMMTHYFSNKRFTGREQYPTTVTFTHEWHDEVLTAMIRHRGNYSTRSLKVGFRLELNRALQFGVFRDKTRLVFRHLVFDETWVNEKTYYDAWDEIHKRVLGFDAIAPTGEYYWVFINDQLYGYYLVLNDSTSELLLGRWEVFDHSNDCIIKAKTWAQDKSADMHYAPLYATLEGFQEVYVLEGGNNQQCADEVIQMMKDLDNGKSDIVLDKFRDPREIAALAQYVDDTNNRTWVHQNYMLIKYAWKWEIAPWDGDLSFSDDYTVDTGFLHENALFSAALDRFGSVLVEKDINPIIAGFFRKNYESYSNAIATDRKIWSRYLPRRDRHIPEEYIQYIDPAYEPDFIANLIKNLWRITYRRILSHFF